MWESHDVLLLGVIQFIVKYGYVLSVSYLQSWFFSVGMTGSISMEMNK